MLSEADAVPEEVGRAEKLLLVEDIVSSVVAGLPLRVGVEAVDPASVAGEVTVSVVEATEVWMTTSVVEAADTTGSEGSADVDTGGGGGGPTAVAEATGVVTGTEIRQPKYVTPGGQ